MNTHGIAIKSIQNKSFQTYFKSFFMNSAHKNLLNLNVMSCHTYIGARIKMDTLPNATPSILHRTYTGARIKMNVL